MMPSTSPQAQDVPPPASGPGSWRRAWIIFLGTIAFGLVTDLASKHYAFKHVAGAPVVLDREQVLREQFLQMLIPAHDPVVVLDRVLELTLVLNPGAVFGLGAGKRAFFMVFTTLALVLAGWAFKKWTGRRDTASHVALGLLVSGGLGNLYDRLVYACVRDFLHPLPNLKYPFGISTPWSGREIWPYISNIADLWLLIGIAVLLARFWRKPEPASSDA